MSTYYSFYLAEKINDKYSICGPYIHEKGEYRLRPLHVRSKSFIDWDEFHRFMNKIPENKMDPEQLKMMCINTSWTDEENLVSSSYVCGYSDMVAASKGNGLRQGYIPLEDFKYVKNENYFISNIYELDNFISIEAAAEMDPLDRRKYGKIAFFETESIDYIANEILTAAAGLTAYQNEDNYYFICVVDY